MQTSVAWQRASQTLSLRLVQPALSDRLPDCFEVGRNSELVVHELTALLRLGAPGLALRHENLNDHDEWCKDKALQACLGRWQPRRAGCQPLDGKGPPTHQELSAGNSDVRKVPQFVAFVLSQTGCEPETRNDKLA